MPVAIIRLNTTNPTIVQDIKTRGGLVNFQSGQKLRFKAGKAIYLYPGFMASSGSDLIFEVGNVCAPVNQNAPFNISSYRLISPSASIDSSSIAGNAISIFPNPSNSGLFTIKSSKTVSISITNLLGQEIYQSSSSASSQELDLSNQSNGIYLVKTTGGGKTNTQKIVISK